MKTISMRIRGAKTELEEAGESTEGMAESTATLRKEMLALAGIDIMLDKNTFKSTYQIMDELSQKWENLSDIAQASITELMAGKHQGNIMSSLMSNFDTARDALNTSLNSSGSAMREHEKWQQSLEAQINKLKAAWQSLSQSFLSSDFLKGVLDHVIALVDGLNKLIDTFGVLPTLLTGFAIFKSFGNKGLFKTFNNDLDGFTNKVGIAGKSLSELTNAFKSANTGGIQGFVNGLKAMGAALAEPLSKSDISAIESYNKLINDGVDSQEAFAKTMNGTSAAAQNMVRSANGSKVALNGMQTATIGVKAGLIAAKVAAVAFNAALTMGISLLIDWAVSGIQKAINAEEELAEKVEELTSKYREQHQELQKLKGNYDTSNESSMISKYEKLSRGVDNLGRNVSLTSEEYSEYQDIVNQIADQIPSLVVGYDEQGNALLSVKGNVEELTAAYEKLIHAQNQEILMNSKKIEKNFKNAKEDKNGYGFGEWLGNQWSLSWMWGDDDTTVFDMKEKTAKYLRKLLNAKSDKEINKILDTLPTAADGLLDISGKDPLRRNEIVQALQKAGYDVDYYSNISKTLKKAIKNEPEKIRRIVDDFYGQFDEEVEQRKAIATAKLSEAFDVSSAISGVDYSHIGENLQAVAYQVVNSLDYFSMSDIKDIEKWTKDLLNQLNSLSEADAAQIDAAFDLQTKFNGGEISYGEYVRNLEDVQSAIDGLSLKDEAKKQLEISLGLDDNGVVDQYEAMVKRLTDSKAYDFNISDAEARNLLDGLSSEDLSIAIGVITEMSDNDVVETIDQVRNAIDRELTLRGLTLDFSMEVETAKLESLATAISESISGSGLSAESISVIEDMFGDLSGYDQSKLFERTANGIRLNSDELRKLNSECKKTNVAELNKEMDSLGDIYNQTREELYRLTYGTKEYDEKAAELSGIEERINATEKLISQYEGLASAYQEWQMVESSGSQRDMYESLIEGLENIDDEIKRGWFDDGTIEFLELLTGQDLSTAGIKKIKEAYRQLNETIGNTSYTIRDFFTVDEDGNSTNTGVYNFLDAIDKLESSKFGGKNVVDYKDGNIVGFDFNIVGGDKVIAEALGISEELVQIMVRAADDAGFVVSMDGTYQNLDILREKAQEAAESLNQILEKNGKEGFDFNFNSSDVDDITKQLTEAQKILDTFRNNDGTINTTIKGAEEALTVASTLQSMLDKLTRPTYMNIEVNQVEKELQEPLRRLQELRRLTETEHQLKLSGADTSQLEESKQEVYKYFEKLSPEVKAQLGLVDENGNPLTGDSLKNRLNAGDIAIEATVDIQLKMDEKLGILVDKALLDAGIIDEEEFKKRVNVYIDADVDNKDAETKTEQAVEGVVNSTKTDVKNAKVEVQSQVNEVKAAKVGVKSEVEGVKSEVSGAKADVEGIKAEIANAKADVEGIAEALKTLQDAAEDTSVSVTANIYGNVPKMDESKEIDDLLMFAAGADALQDLPEMTNVSVYAQLDGNVPDLNEGEQTDDLLMFAAGVEALQGLPAMTSVEVHAYIDEDTKDLMNLNEGEQIDDLLMFAAGVEALQGLPRQTSVSVTANLDGNVPDLNEGEQIDDLMTFAAGAEALQKLPKDISVNVTANLNGNVPDLNEGKQIDDLMTFANGAKALKNLGLGKDESISVSVDANLNGNVPDLNEGEQIDDIITFAEGAKALKDLGLGKEESISVNVAANLYGNVPDLNEGEQIDDIITFAEGAADLKALGLKDDESISVSVTANLDGNVPDLNEGEQINDLMTFAKGAADLKALGLGKDEDISVNVTANLNGNVSDLNEGEQIDDIITFAEGAKALKDLGLKDDESISVSVTANLDGNVPDLNEGEQINDIITFAEGAKALQELDDDIGVNVTANLDGNVPDLNEGEQIDDLMTFAAGANALQGLPVTTSVSVLADVYGNAITGDGAADRLASLSEFNSVVNTLTPNQNVTITVTANVDSENVNKAIQLLKDVSSSGVFKDYKATVQVGAKVTTVDDTVIQDYIATEKKAKGKVEWTNDETWVDKFKSTIHEATGKVNWENNLTNVKKSFSASGTVTWTSGNNVKVDVVSNANGTANADGTAGRAFARGDWGVKQTTTALTGELGQELVVYKNRFWTVGDNGAEFTTIPRGAIVFNHRQTEELFANGKVTSDGGRGKMFASGTAFAGGSSGSGGAGKVVGSAVKQIVDGVKQEVKKSVSKKKGSSGTADDSTGKPSGGSKPSSSGSKPSSSNSSANKDFEETFDWIEIAIERIERAIDKLDKKAGNIYKSWSERNAALSKEIGKVREEIALQESAAQRYLEEANSVGLSESYAAMVRNGEIDIDTIKDEGLAEKIREYQKWYELYLKCTDAAEDLREEEAKLYAQRVSNVAAQYEGILGVIEHEQSMLQEYISQSEAQGWMVSGEYYNALANNERENLAQLQQEKETMLAEMQAAMESGTIEVGSEAWYEMVASIDEVTLSIAQSQTALLEYEQTLQQLNWQVFDMLQDKISAVAEESNFLIELLSSDKLYDDNGQLTDSGMATMALHGQNYNTYMHQADNYAAEIARLDEEIAKDPYDQDLINRRAELVQAQQDAILAAQGEKEAIRDLVKEGIELELGALQERIDKYNEALESQRDLYEYQKKVKEQTKEIASLQKQMSAYAGDDSEEAKAKIQELKVSLEEAEESLRESEYEKYMSGQKELLDALYNEYSEVLNTRLDNLDALVADMVDGINANATTISETISETAESVGYELSESMQTIWNSSSENIGNVITTYGDKFSSAQTTTNNALNTINTNLQNMIAQLNTLAQTNTQSASTSSAANSSQANAKPSNTSNTSNTTTEPDDTSSANNTIKIGSKINAGNAKIYSYAGSNKGLKQYYGKDPIYQVLDEKNGYLKVRWHKLSSGATGWFKKTDVKAYATGKRRINVDDMAWTQENGREFIIRPSDGAVLTPVASGDSVLNAVASSNLWNMANSPEEFIRDNLDPHAINGRLFNMYNAFEELVEDNLRPHLINATGSNLLDIANASAELIGDNLRPYLIGAVNSNILDTANASAELIRDSLRPNLFDAPSHFNANNNYTQHLDRVVFNFPNVQNYEEMLESMRRDRTFEQLVLSMSVDRISGRSPLAKKSIRK